MSFRTSSGGGAVLGAGAARVDNLVNAGVTRVALAVKKN
jgi:hypothetical protein